MLDLDKEDRCCLLTDLMEEAEQTWKSVLKRETIASLSNEIHSERFQVQVEGLETWLNEKMVV